jgi:hypothetical protein
MSKEKLCSCLNLWGLHTWQSVPYSFVELQLRVVVVGVPLLAVYEVAGRTWASSVRHCWWRYGKINRVSMFSKWISIWYCLKAENQPCIKRKVLSDNLSSSPPCKNLGSSGPKLRHLVIHPFLGLCTDRATHLNHVRDAGGCLGQTKIFSGKKQSTLGS